MKKLMMIVASMAVACSVHAASMVWGFSSADSLDYNGNYIGDSGNGYSAVDCIAYLYLGTVTASENAFDLTKATLVAQGGQNANFTFGELDPTDNAKVPSTAANQAYSLILVEDNGKSLDSYEGRYILSTGVSQQGTDPMSGATWAIFADPTPYAAADWDTMTAAPEPTSGLLLLMGMGLLGLRRKRA